MVTRSNMVKMKSVARQIPEFHSLFDRILTAEDFTASKPAPDCYLLGARVFDADIQECVVFEDAFTGLQAGMSSGIMTVGLTTGLTAEQIKDKCNHIIPDFTGVNYDSIAALLSDHWKQ